MLNLNNPEKICETKSIYSVYKTTGDDKKEKAGSYILLGSITYNSKIKSIKLSTSAALAGGVVDLVLLDYNGNEATNSLKSNISLANALNSAEQMTLANKLKTLNEIASSKDNGYRNVYTLAFKITTAPTTATADVIICADIQFIDNI